MNNYIVVVAGGRGLRMGTSLPKQFIKLRGKAILHHTLQRFHDVLPLFKLIVVLPATEMDYWKSYCREEEFNIPHTIVEGGKERFFSVKTALDQIKTAELVGIHDGVRPFVSASTILNTKTKAENSGNAIPVLPLKESIRLLKNNGESRAVKREAYKLVQTPQFFNFKQLHEAYNQNYNAEFTDDASVVENLGIKINMVEGNPENIKLTTPLDLKLAEILVTN